MQHQRLLQSISERAGSRFIFSGDIHALGATSILQSDTIKLQREVKTFLVGPISSSTGTWPSFARGITADNPNQLIFILDQKRQNHQLIKSLDVSSQHHN